MKKLIVFLDLETNGLEQWDSVLSVSAEKYLIDTNTFQNRKRKGRTMRGKYRKLKVT